MAAVLKQQFAVNEAYDLENVDKTSLEHNRKLIAALARRVHQRVVAAGLPIEFDDLHQMALLAWVNARRLFSPERGARFTSYLTPIVLRALNKYVEREKRRAFAGQTVSIYGEGEDDETSLTLEEVLASDAHTPEEIETLRQSYKEFVAGLSTPARLLLRYLQDPPEHLNAEFNAYQAKLRARGDYVPKEITLSFALKYLGKLSKLSKPELRRVRKEVEQIVNAL